MFKTNYAFSLYENVRKTFFPVLWFEQTVILEDDMAFQINIFLKVPLFIKISAIVFILIGICLYLRARYLIKFKGKNTKLHREKLIDLLMDSMYS